MKAEQEGMRDGATHRNVFRLGPDSGGRRPLGDLNNRLPALFELRRQFWPRYEALAEAPGGQDIDGFLRAVFMQNFALFGEQAAKVTGESVDHMERRTSAADTLLTDAVLDKYDTLSIISFDSRRPQAITPAETEALRGFLARPETMLFVCPHHDIGDLPKDAALRRQTAEFAHHGDVTLPGQQRTGGFAVSLMAALGAPVRNRFGLRPAATEHGDPAPFHLAGEDKQRLLTDVPTSTCIRTCRTTNGSAPVKPPWKS